MLKIVIMHPYASREIVSEPFCFKEIDNEKLVVNKRILYETNDNKNEVIRHKQKVIFVQNIILQLNSAKRTCYTSLVVL